MGLCISHAAWVGRENFILKTLLYIKGINSVWRDNCVYNIYIINIWVRRMIYFWDLSLRLSIFSLLCTFKRRVCEFMYNGTCEKLCVARSQSGICTEKQYFASEIEQKSNIYRKTDECVYLTTEKEQNADYQRSRCVYYAIRQRRLHGKRGFIDFFEKKWMWENQKNRFFLLVLQK